MVSGSYKLKDGKPVDAKPSQLNDTHYLFDLPAKAIAFSVLARVLPQQLPAMPELDVRKQWTFTDVSERRTLAIELVKRKHVRIHVDSIHGPLPATPVRPSLTVIVPDDPLWSAWGTGTWGWMVKVPEAGLTGITLRAKATAVCDYAPGLENRDNQCWWKALGGKPVRAAMRYREMASFDFDPGAGELWLIADRHGRTCYQRTTLSTTDQYIPADHPGPSLGLLFPLPADLRMPGKVTLIGKGGWAGVQVEFSDLAWFPSTALNLIVGQVDAVPPGDWLVRVETAKGIVEKTVTVTEAGGEMKSE